MIRTTISIEWLDEMMFAQGMPVRSFVEWSQTPEFIKQYGLHFSYYVDENTFEPFLQYRFINDQCQMWFTLKYSNMVEFLITIVTEYANLTG